MMGPAGAEQLQQLITRLIAISISIAFVILVIMILYAGVKYLMSGGDPANIKTAHQALTWAVFGFIFLAMAWVVLVFIKTFTGVDVLNVCIGFAGVSTACP